MQIIIVGCGKVGRVLTRELSGEDHNITIIDINSDVVKRIAMSYDVMGIQGNGTSYAVLEQADIQHTDILIAVTYSDEVNLLCCFLAKRWGQCRTIARVRNPLYSSERAIFRKELGISFIINPEREAAREIAKLLQFPQALEISTFAKGRIELIRFRTTEKFPFLNQPLREVFVESSGEMLVCVAERGDDVLIPNGDFVIRQGDVLSIITAPDLAGEMFARFGEVAERINNTLIVGGGELGYYLGELLLRRRMAVKIIDIDKARCEELCEALPGASVICGDGSDREILEEENIDKMDAFVSATGMDEENVILSLYAKQRAECKTVTKISHQDMYEVIKNLNLDSILNPLDLTADSILRYVRAMHNSEGSNMETLYKLCDGKVEAMEFIIQPDSKIVDTPLREMKLKDNILIAGIFREGHLIIPTGNDVFKTYDSVIIATTHEGFQNIEDILERQRGS